MWKPSISFPKIEVSKDGRLRTWHSGWNRHVEKQPRYDKDGYYIIGTRHDDGRTTTARVHRLVAEAYIPNPDNLPVINHINGIKNDNRVENLEWSSVAQNTQHGYDYLGVLSAQSKPIRLYIDGKRYSDYQSITRMCEIIGLDRNSYKDFEYISEGYFSFEEIDSFELNNEVNLPVWRDGFILKTRGTFYRVDGEYYDTISEIASIYNKNRTTIHRWYTKGHPDKLDVAVVSCKEYLENTQHKNW